MLFRSDYCLGENINDNSPIIISKGDFNYGTYSGSNYDNSFGQTTFERKPLGTEMKVIEFTNSRPYYKYVYLKTYLVYPDSTVSPDNLNKWTIKFYDSCNSGDNSFSVQSFNPVAVKFNKSGDMAECTIIINTKQQVGDTSYFQWTDKGCYSDPDTNNRVLKNNLSYNVNSVNECKSLASLYGYNVIGLQYNSECWADNMTSSDSKYNKHGKVDAQYCDKLGGTYINHVYVNENSITSTTTPSTTPPILMSTTTTTPSTTPPILMSTTTTTPSTTPPILMSTTTTTMLETPIPTFTSASVSADKLAEKGIKVLGSYLNNPMPYALKYSSPGTFLSQIDYKGSTNIYSPLIQMKKQRGIPNERFSNINDPDKYYHII